MPDVHDEEEFAPDFTAPQGIQQPGLTTGHEAKDVNFGAIVGWFSGLAAGTIAVMALVAGAAIAWNTYMAREEREPTFLRGATQAPPRPRLIPNPADDPQRLNEPLP